MYGIKIPNMVINTIAVTSAFHFYFLQDVYESWQNYSNAMIHWYTTFNNVLMMHEMLMILFS